MQILSELVHTSLDKPGVAQTSPEQRALVQTGTHQPKSAQDNPEQHGPRSIPRSIPEVHPDV